MTTALPIVSSFTTILTVEDLAALVADRSVSALRTFYADKHGDWSVYSGSKDNGDSTFHGVMADGLCANCDTDETYFIGMSDGSVALALPKSSDDLPF